MRRRSIAFAGVMPVEAAKARPNCRTLRLATSAGEALPVELDRRWRDTFGVDLLDGLGTAEMWHIFISNRPGAARPGTLGQVVPGVDIKACDDDGREVAAGETGWLWVRGDSRAIGYWQNLEKTSAAFRGDWYVTGDLVAIDADGFVTYGGRGDEMLKVSGKWLAPQEVESCLLAHHAVHVVDAYLHRPEQRPHLDDHDGHEGDQDRGVCQRALPGEGHAHQGLQGHAGGQVGLVGVAVHVGELGVVQEERPGRVLGQAAVVDEVLAQPLGVVLLVELVELRDGLVQLGLHALVEITPRVHGRRRDVACRRHDDTRALGKQRAVAGERQREGV